MTTTASSSRINTVFSNAVGRLRGAIMRGDLRPGQKLVEGDLCLELGVSRASLREALRTLETERLIEVVPNRGPSVSKLGWKEIEEIHDVWAMLTGEAVYRFAPVASGDELMAIKDAFTRLERALRAENALDQLAATNAIFGPILARCGNRILIDVVTSLVSRLNFLRAQALRYEGWGYLCAHEISTIIAAIERNDADAARAATHQHIDSACAAAKQVALLPDAPKAVKKRGRLATSQSRR